MNLYQVDNTSVAVIVGVNRFLVVSDIVFAFQLVVCRIVACDRRGGVATRDILWFIVVTAVYVVFGAVAIVGDAIRIIWIVTL